MISVTNQKPTDFRLTIIRAAIPNIGFINFLGLKELPSYQNQGGTTGIIQNLMKLDNNAVKLFNLDKIEQGSRVDILLPNIFHL